MCIYSTYFHTYINTYASIFWTTSIQGKGKLEPIPGDLGDKSGDTMDGEPTHKTYTHKL